MTDNKFSNTLSGRPILKDHESKTDNTIGKVLEGKSINNGKEVAYSGWIKEDGTGIIERIKDGRISEVSIGAVCGKLVKESESSDVLIAKDMTALELSTTPTPGVVGTSISQTIDKYQEEKLDSAISNYIQLHEAINTIELMYKCPECGKKMKGPKEAVMCPDCGCKMKKMDESYSTEKSEENIIQSEKEVKMESTQEKKIEGISVNESMVKEVAELKAKLDEATKLVESMKEAKRQEAISAYKKLCESKKIAAKELSSMSMETIQTLIDTIASIPEAKTEAKEIAQPKSVEVTQSEKTVETLKGYVVESSSLGGQAFYKVN